MAADPAWSASQRLEGLAGEVRVNLIRLIAVVDFYGPHLVNVFLIRDDPSLKGAYHTGLLAGRFVLQCRRLVSGSPVPVEEETPV